MRNLLIIIAICLYQYGNTMNVNRDGDVLYNDNNPNSSYVIDHEFGIRHENEEGIVPQENTTNSNFTRGLLSAQYEKCRKSKGFLDCFKFGAFKFAKDLFEFVASSNVSEISATQTIQNKNSVILVRLPRPNPVQSVLAKAIQRAFGSSGPMEIFGFVVEELDRFLSRHGLMITVKDTDGDGPENSDSPWLVDFEKIKGDRDGRKVKKKEYAIIFPMLVLFKFLKIKMLLVPILLGVVFLKKLLIITLTLLPYLVGLFGCCRRPPFLPPIQSAGILQEVDTRGEFATNLGYSFPYKDGFSFRQKDRARPSDIYSEY